MAPRNLYLSDDVIGNTVFRKESFGGFIFNKKMHTITEVNKVQLKIAAFLLKKITPVRIKKLLTKRDLDPAVNIDRNIKQVKLLLTQMNSYWDGIKWALI